MTTKLQYKIYNFRHKQTKANCNKPAVVNKHKVSMELVFVIIQHEPTVFKHVTISVLCGKPKINKE